MKTALLSIALVTPLLLASCAKTEEEKVERLTEELIDASNKADAARNSDAAFFSNPSTSRILGAPPKPLKELTPEQKEAYSQSPMRFVRENPDLFDPEEARLFLPLPPPK